MRRAVNATFVCLALIGCVQPGQMLPGNLIADNGNVLDFQIEVASRSGGVAAFDPKTGEQFTGTYVGILERISSFSSGSATVSGSAGSVTASGFGSTRTGSNIGNATAFLKGTKGTTLNCKIQIEAGLNPHGIGTCRDQRNQGYRLQF